MQEAASLQTLHQALRNRQVLDVARCQVVAALDDLVAINLDERDRLGVTGLKSDGGSGGNVKTETVGPDAVELQLGVCLDEVVVRADLPLSAP